MFVAPVCFKRARSQTRHVELARRKDRVRKHCSLLIRGNEELRLHGSSGHMLFSSLLAWPAGRHSENIGTGIHLDIQKTGPSLFHAPNSDQEFAPQE